MQYNIIHHEYDYFYFILKKHLKLSQKIDFLARFERFSVYAFLRPMSYIQIFSQIESLIEVHTRGKFISLAFVAAKLQMFKCFRGNAASMKPPFWEVSELFLP